MQFQFGPVFPPKNHTVFGFSFKAIPALHSDWPKMFMSRHSVLVTRTYTSHTKLWQHSPTNIRLTSFISNNLSFRSSFVSE